MAGTAPLAWAQQPARARDAGKKLAQLDTVVVTARRREEALRDVPQAITAISGEELESRGARDIAALGEVTPNLTIYPTRAFNGTVTAFIRGIGQADPIWSVEPGVGVYVDDVYLARPQGALLDILDVERVEVLRGPQGTLYGKNTLGGAIKLVTREPSADFSGSASLTAGDYRRRDGKLVLNLPLGDRLRTRLALAQFDRGGFGHNLVTGEEVSARDTRVARINASWSPSEDVEVRLAYDRTVDDSGAQGFKRLAVNPLDPAATPPDPGNHDVRSGAPGRQRLAAGGGSATLDWALGTDWRLRAISAWRSGHSMAYIDFDTLPLQISTLERYFRDRQASHEIQLHWSDGGRAHAVAGLYLFDGDSGGVGINSSRNPTFGYSSSTIDTRSAALYANLTRPIGAALELDLGLRYTVERKGITVFNRSYADRALTTPVAEPTADFSDAATFRAPSPRVVLSWRPSATAMLYAQASRGFKGGSYNISANRRLLPRSSHAVDDEAVTAFELGAKTAWLDDRLDLDLALFHNTYRDIQLSVFTSYDRDGDGVNDSLFRDFRNAGDGHSRGAELEWRMRAGLLRWSGQVGYLDAGYDRYVDGGLDLAASRRFSNAPRWTAGSSLVADFPLRAGMLRARIDGRYQSKVWQTAELDDAVAQAGYALWNASLAWTSPAQGWQVALHGNNLRDKAYRTTGFSFPTLGILTGHYGAPRTFALTLTRSF